MPDVPLVVSDVARWYAVTSLALGLRTGLADALLAGGGTVDDLAAAAGVDRRNAEVWARAMIAVGYAGVEDGRVVAIDDTVGVLRGGLPFDFRAAVEVLAPMGALLPEVERAIRDGRGIDSADIQRALGSLPELVNGPMYQRFLVEDWIGSFPELEAALRAGIDIAEIGPGGGGALLILAREFPRSRFVGFDIDPAQVARANAAASTAERPNATFRAVDAANLPTASFDLVCVFDAFHHFARPDAALDAVHRALRPGGSLLIAETSLSGDPTTDSDDPLSPISYGCDLLYCFQESKANDGMGLGATWAPQHLGSFLSEHGFRVASTHASDAGYLVTRAEPKTAV